MSVWSSGQNQIAVIAIVLAFAFYLIFNPEMLFSRCADGIIVSGLIILSKALVAVTGEVSMGTTIMAAKYRDGVVVAADTRTSVSGYISNRFSSKLTFVLSASNSPSPFVYDEFNKIDAGSFSTCCICRSGSAADTQQLAFLVEQELLARHILNNAPGSVTSAAYLTRSLLRENPDWSCGLICAGYDHISECGKIYSIAPSGAIFEEDFMALGGSGSTYVMGHVEAIIKDRINKFNKGADQKFPDMDEEECVEMVGRAIELAISSDASSGGFVRIYVIDKYGSRPMIRMPLGSIGKRMSPSSREI